MPETPWDDPAYLKSQQYPNASNLNARMALHERFHTNPKGWHRWVFEQLELPKEARLLEVGCGPGELWAGNAERLPPGWQVMLSDFSPGMARDGQTNLAARRIAARLAACDARALAFPSGSFDAAIANHMLYHVPDRSRAIAELHRVLKPAGRLYAATNGRNHMHELDELLRRYDLAADPGKPILPFSLENGAGQLRAYFSQVELRIYEDALKVTEAGPLAAYAASMIPYAGQAEREGWLNRLEEFLAAELSRQGTIHIRKEVGLFVAIKG